VLYTFHVLCTLSYLYFMYQRGALLEIYESKVVRVNGKSFDKTNKVTLCGGDEVVFNTPVRHAYVSFLLPTPYPVGSLLALFEASTNRI
jgi:hypothetical protein